MTDNIYHELILELARNPMNRGVPANFDEKFVAQNRVCGDNFIFYVKWDENTRAKEVKWSGDGCALSVSSASLFSEYINGKTKLQMSKIKPAQILKLLRLKKLNPSRSRCAFLPLESFQNSK